MFINVIIAKKHYHDHNEIFRLIQSQKEIKRVNFMLFPGR